MFVFWRYYDDDINRWIKFLVYQEFDEIDQRSILLNSIHSIRIVEAITNPDTLQPKYLEFDAEMLKVISVNFPSLTSINEDLRDLSESLRELRLDSQEITIYKAYLALFSSNSLDFRC